MKAAFQEFPRQIHLAPASAVPLFRQLYLALRDEIIAKRMRPGMRLPSTRTLASHLRVARNTVINAYEQLVAEGYVEGRIGSGTRVAKQIPIDMIGKISPRSHRADNTDFLSSSRRDDPKIFGIDEPAYDAFPFETMRRLITNRMREDFPALLSNKDPAGLPQLRRAIARYVSNERGIRCNAGEIVITAGSLHGLDLVIRALGLTE